MNPVLHMQIVDYRLGRFDDDPSGRDQLLSDALDALDEMEQRLEAQRLEILDLRRKLDKAGGL